MMERRELEERYTAVGRPLPTDVGRMVRNVALVRLALLVGCGTLLVIGLCVFGGLAWFAIVGTSSVFASPTPTPVPTALPVSSVLPHGAGPRGDAATWSAHTQADTAACPRLPGAGAGGRGPLRRRRA